MRVLLVDDDASLRALFSIWLGSLPDAPELTHAATLAEAHERLASERPDVVLLDHGLPDGDGLECARELIAADPDLDVILVTGNDTPELERAAEEMGIADFLPKQNINQRALARSIRWARRRSADRASLAASARHHREVIRHLPGALIALYDRNLRCVLIEGSYLEELRGTDAPELIGKHVSDIAPVEERDGLITAMQAALDGEPQTVHYNALASGRRLVLQVVPYRDAEDQIVGVLNVATDVTAEHAAEEQRRNAERRFALAFERAPDGMAILGLDGRFEQVNGAMCELLERSREGLLRLNPVDLVHDEDRAGVVRDMTEVRERGTDTTLEFRVARAGGTARWVQLQLTVIADDEGRPLHALAQLSDITARRRTLDEMAHQARRDSLTGLLNRRGFLEVLHNHLAHARRYGPDGAVLMIDLDGFKNVNDTHGHAAGDQVLIACAAALGRRLRETDHIGRLGGDEFAVLVPTGRREETDAVALAVVETLADAAVGGPGVTASVGVAVIDASDVSAEQVLAHADRALYAAKGAGKNRYVFSDQPLSDMETGFTAQ